MWFLDINNLFILFFFSIIVIILNNTLKNNFLKAKKSIIIAVNIIFLMIFSKKLLAFYFINIFLNYLLIKVIYKSNRFKKYIFLLSIFINLLLVIIVRLFDYYSYNNIFFSNVNLIGLIYYLLKIIDVLYFTYYTDEMVNIKDLLAYILFVPTFTSGPITQYFSFNKQFFSYIKIKPSDLEIYIKRIILGLFKKVVIVKFLYEAYNSILENELDPISSSLVLLIYYILLYLDFSGYSDIAIGFSGLFGIKVPENFKKPFSSPTLTQFWRNWHITLGDWFRNHIYMPFANKINNRQSAAFLSFFIMLLIGLWHGFNILFLMWGIYHGVFLFLENILDISKVQKKKVSRIYFLFRCIITNLIVAFGTIFFSQNVIIAKKILLGFLNFD